MQSARLLSTMPGVSDVTAHVIVAEIGMDMTRFPSDAHLRSWAGFCPRSDESAGKRRSTRVRKGAPWLKTALVTAAYHMLKNGIPYHDLGAEHFSSRDRSKAILRLVRILNDLRARSI